MRVEKEKKAISLTVTEGLTVTVLPDSNYEFLMSTDDVATGYGTSDYVVRKTKLRHESELVENKHFIYAGTICPSDPYNKIYWTKRGVIRLGFFIKSKISQQFRDWAEDLVIKVDEQRNLFNDVVITQKSLPAKRLINRIDRNRMVRLLAMTSQIDDRELRNNIVNELMAGFDYSKGGNYGM